MTDWDYLVFNNVEIELSYFIYYGDNHQTQSFSF